MQNDDRPLDEVDRLSELGFMSPQSLLAAIVDSSHDPIISKNLDSIVTSWNAAAQRLFGYTADEMIGTPILRLLPDDRKEEEVDILAKIGRGERIENYETIRIRKDRQLIEVSLTISPVRNQEGVIVGASKIVRDITEQKDATRRLAAAHEEVVKADRMKADFISTLSHELRTPLSAITGWIALLKDGATPEDLKHALSVIERNVRAQTQMIDDLLDMSRIESGKLILDVQRLDLPVIVGAAIDSIQPAADAKGIRLKSAFSSVAGYVMGDRNRIQQIVWNLLANAIKFTPNGGRVHTVIERIDSNVEISVSDTGMGIPVEYLDRIFDRFSQEDTSTTRKHGGLGLGLAIVKHLTELHGGTVHAKSRGKGEGATFIVRLPLVAAHREPETRKVDQRHAKLDANMVDGDLSGVTILSVEDDPDSSEIVRKILERRGATVKSASSMNEALRLFKEQTPDLILSDIGMPEHDGYELLSQIRALPGGRNVPAVALTALARSEDRTRTLRAGFQMHVAKPVEAAELVAVVHNLAELRRRD